MADIVIRGMEMPRDCLGCRFTYGESFCDTDLGVLCYCMASNESKLATRPSRCPLVPLPEGHGDLIDRDAFRADNGLGKDCENCDRNTRNCNYDICLSRMDVCGWIDDAPTIVPAEGGGEV